MLEAFKKKLEGKCLGCDLDMDNEFHAVQIEVEIVDKIMPNAMVDDRGNVNVMREVTMKKLELFLAYPFPYSI